VRLPLESADLALFDVPLGVGDPATGARVRLSAQLAGREQVWSARLVRSEGEIDPRTRMLHVVARVDDPYGRQGSKGVPLPAGLFVRGEIAGRELEAAYSLPSIALREGERVYVLDAADRIVIRPVHVVRRERDRLLINAGLEPGDRVVVSPMRFATEGMQVGVAAGEAP
jgi:multidrug efflux pump subunit AcrA (membrane-fusion protein)